MSSYLTAETMSFYLVQYKLTCCSVWLPRQCRSTWSSTSSHAAMSTDRVLSYCISQLSSNVLSAVHHYCLFQKVTCSMFDNNCDKCRPIFRILSPGDSQENSVCTHHKDFHFTCSMLLHYLVKVEKLKCYQIFTFNVTIKSRLYHSLEWYTRV